MKNIKTILGRNPDIFFIRKWDSEKAKRRLQWLGFEPKNVRLEFAFQWSNGRLRRTSLKLDSTQSGFAALAYLTATNKTEYIGIHS